MNNRILYLPQIPKCQFCESDCKYETASTDTDTFGFWVYSCEQDFGIKTTSDLSIGRLVEVIQ